MKMNETKNNPGLVNIPEPERMATKKGKEIANALYVGN